MPKVDPDDIKWGYPAIMKFIGLLRKYSLLWNRNSPYYKKPKMRTAAINKIANAMGTTPVKIRNKIHVMRSQCRKENMQLKRNKDYVPKWKYFNDVRHIFTVDAAMSKQRRKEYEKFENSDYTEDENTVDYESIVEDDGEKGYHSPFLKQQYDEFKIIGENIADKLRLLNDYKSIQLAFKCKVMQALLEANSALCNET